MEDTWDLTSALLLNYGIATPGLEMPGLEPGTTCVQSKCSSRKMQFFPSDEYMKLPPYQTTSLPHPVNHLPILTAGDCPESQADVHPSLSCYKRSLVAGGRTWDLRRALLDQTKKVPLVQNPLSYNGQPDIPKKSPAG